MVGVVSMTGLPRSKIRYDPLHVDEGGAYTRAPLDTISFVNGTLKWEHDYCAVSFTEYNDILQWLHYLYGHCMVVQAQAQPRAGEKARETEPESQQANPYRASSGDE
jgi:hypothetical protein